MAIATTQIIITAKDSTAAAFASVNSGLTGLGGAAIKASAALSAIGATAAIGSFVAFTKQTLEAQDSLSKLSQKTGIAVESLAGLEFAAEQSGVEIDKVAKATRTFSLLVAEAADESSGAATKLKQLGLSYKDLKDLSPEKQLLALADALQKFSKDDRPIAFTSIFGNKIADLIPLLSGGSKELGALIEQGKKFNPVTEQSAKQAERFNDQLNVLSKSVSTLGREFVQGMIPGLTRVADTMVSVTQQSGLLAGALAGVKQLFVESFGNPKILGDVGQIRREILKTQETIKGLELKKDSVFFDKNALLHEQEKLVQLDVDLKKAIGTSRDVIAAQDASTESTKKFAIALDDANKPLSERTSKIDSLTKRINDQGRVESEYIKLLKIERQAQDDLLKPYQQSAASAQDRLQSLRQEAQALDLSQREQISVAEAIEKTTIARLQEKRAISTNSNAIAEIDKEIAARKQIITVIKQGEDKTKGMVGTTRSATDDVSQLWMQAGRNIQSALANGIFNFFDDGLKGMVKNVASTVGRILSEFAALKLAQGIGLAGMFGASGAASASTGGGSLFSGAVNLGSSAVNLFSSGGGISKGISGLLGLGGSSGIFSNAGGAATAFIGGPGTALGGSGMGGFASMGSSLGAAAGPIMAAFAVDAIGRALAGDKKLGGAEYIPVLGGFLAAMFGRGPMKFRQQSLQGDVSSSGFDGDITNVFRAKGGLFVGNKHKSVTEQLSQDQQDLFDQTIKGFYTSAHGFAENLGFSTDLVDTFTKTIQIKSEKGKKLTEEAITEMIQGIGDSLAKNVIPSIDEFRKAGEKSFDTFARLNNEFLGLTAGAQNLGASVGYAKDLISSMSISARTELVDSAGGLEALSTKTGFFFSNFLTQTEQFDVKSSALTDGLHKLGLSADLTVDQFKSLVQSTSTANDLRVGLLNLAPAFVEVKGAIDSLFGDTLAATQNRAAASRELEQTISNNIITGWRNLIDSVSEEIDKLRGFADSLKGTINSILPQSLDSARAEIINATSAASGGQITDVSGALSTLSNQSSSGFSNRLDFERSKAFSATLITGLSDAILASISDKQSMISGYNSNISLVQSGKPTNQINGSTQVDVATLLQNLITQTAASGQYSKDLYNLLRNMTNNGTALNTVAA